MATGGRSRFSSSLLLPGHLYELMPIAVLIGTIFALARLAQVPNTRSCAPAGSARGGRSALLLLGLAFGVLTFAVGDYVAPVSERPRSCQGALSECLRSSGHGRLAQGKARRHSYLGQRRARWARWTLRDVRIFEFDAKGRLTSRSAAASARAEEGVWTLGDVERTGVRNAGDDQARISTTRTRWSTGRPRSRRMVVGRRAAVPTMRTLDLCATSATSSQRADGAALRDPVLAQGALSVLLPGDDRAGPALRLPALPLGRHQT